MTLAASTRVALPAEPYPGLRPFEPNEHRIFFGREEMIDTVIDALARKNLVVVHGASGSGKSSFVRAGVLPWLNPTEPPTPLADEDPAAGRRSLAQPRLGIGQPFWCGAGFESGDESSYFLAYAPGTRAHRAR